MVRLTMDLLETSEQAINAARHRQLTLRGQHLDALENLGITKDHYECLDFSDNNILKVPQFPPLVRLKTLLLANNHISRLAEECFKHTPALESIVFTKNKLRQLGDLEPLSKCKSLKRLTFGQNDVCTMPDYRLFVVYLMRNTELRILDFKRITDKERKTAEAKYSGPTGAALFTQIASARHVEQSKNAAGEKVAKEKTTLTPTQADVVKKLITTATDLRRIDILEKMYKTGEVPELFFELYPTYAATFRPAEGAPNPAALSKAAMSKAAPKTAAMPKTVAVAKGSAKRPSPKRTSSSPKRMEVDEERTLEPVPENGELKAKAGAKAKAVMKTAMKTKPASDSEGEGKKTPKTKAKAKSKK